ncbi:MAG: hypothetical protein CL693_18405 [Cellvibrionaceae bacterium]|nr:hypothetical protein [Cellvibrionaceae bacterium]|tara:strand:- start:6389 stop:8029 length:1641 start_codon:yes stop_codon:yes gene_type:complete
MTQETQDQPHFFYNATLWAGNKVEPIKGWFSVMGGKFQTVHAGDLPAQRKRNSTNLNGRHVLPGLVDCHSHLSVSAWIPFTLDGSGWHNKSDLLRDVRLQAKKLDADAWIIAFYADFFRLGALPSLLELNEAAQGRPLIIQDFSLHKGLASEAAYERASISRMNFSSRDLETNKQGVPTGLLKETVNGHTLSIALTQFAQQFESLNMQSLLQAEANRHLSLGIVECHDPCMHPKLQTSAERFERQTPLKFSWSHVKSHEQADYVSDNVCLSCGAGPRSAKMFLDGADDCALCLKPSDVLKMSARSVGQAVVGKVDTLRAMSRVKLTYREGKIRTPFLRLPHDGVTQQIVELAEQGVRPKIHALGNEAVSCACDSLQKSGVTDATVEHLVLMSDDNLEQVARSGAVASLQPGFLQQAKALAASNVHCVLKVIPAKSLSQVDVPIALSSDNPCGPLNPLANIRRAVTRLSDDGLLVDENESLSPSEAIRAYSIGGQQAIHGRPGVGIEARAPANFVVISGHPMHSYSEVMETWIDGECVFSQGWSTLV